jgi:ethanolamine utilization protein EutN
MVLGQVMGTARATLKHPSMEGWRLLVVQPYTTDGRTPDGDPQIAIDHLGARAGDQVIITSDGRGTRELMGRDDTPVRWSVMGIQDPSAKNN